MFIHRSTLFNLDKIFEKSTKNSNLFLKALKEIMNFQYKNCKFYKVFLNSKNFDINKINTEKDIYKIPFIHADFFKNYTILCVDKKEIFNYSTSSGTSGQKSQMFFDKSSCLIGQTSVDKTFNYFNFISNQKTNYLLYSYEPNNKIYLGTTQTDLMLTKYAPINKLFFALPFDGHKHQFDVFGCIRILQQYEKEKIPVRILGFPAFLYFTLKQMKSMKIKNLKLPENSCVILSGGWKNYDHQKISKFELYNMIEKQLGIKNNMCRDCFGSLEHSLPYFECKYHHMHIPVWSRVCIRNVKTLKPISYEKPGFINFISPHILSMPTTSILTGDIAILHEGKKCSCEIDTPYFEILKRAGSKSSKTCAIKALDLLKT